MSCAIVAVAAVMIALAAIGPTTAQEPAQGFDPCAPGQNFFRSSGWHELACAEDPETQLAARPVQMEEWSNLTLKYTGQPLQARWKVIKLYPSRTRRAAEFGAGSVPFILRTPTLPECDHPDVQYTSRGGYINLECRANTVGKHPVHIWLGTAGQQRAGQTWFAQIKEDLPNPAAYARSLLPDVETGDRVRIVGQGSSYPEFHFEVINNSEKTVTHVSIRAIFQDNGGFKVGDECGQYGATWRFNTSIAPNRTRWLAITREACLSRATRFGTDLLDATFADGSRYRP